MTFYEGIKDISSGMVAEFGLDFVYRRKSTAHNPIAGEVIVTSTDYSGKCVKTKITKSFEGFENVKAGDQLILTTSDVQRGDEVTVQSETFEVAERYPVSPGGEMVLNKVLIR